MTVNDLSYVSINNANKINGYTEVSNGSSYLPLVPLKRDEELWKKIKNFNITINNNLGNFDEKYIKVKFNLDADLSLKNARALWHGNSC